jgi:hypothetical protein
MMAIVRILSETVNGPFMVVAQNLGTAERIARY